MTFKCECKLEGVPLVSIYASIFVSFKKIFKKTNHEWPEKIERFSMKFMNFCLKKENRSKEIQNQVTAEKEFMIRFCDPISNNLDFKFTCLFVLLAKRCQKCYDFVQLTWCISFYINGVNSDSPTCQLMATFQHVTNNWIELNLILYAYKRKNNNNMIIVRVILFFVFLCFQELQIEMEFVFLILFSKMLDTL